MFKGYLSLGGNEIANARRAHAYVYNSGAGIPLRDCEDCDGILPALGVEAYTSPLADDAPWFDPNRPETQRFYGFYPLDVQGIEDSTREADVVENVNDGGTVGSVRHGSRSIRVKGLLLAADELSLSAGMTWLRAALDPDECSDHGGSCGGAQLCYWAACPEICEMWDSDYNAGDSVAFVGLTPENTPETWRYSAFNSIWTATFMWESPQEGVIVRYGAARHDDVDAWVDNEEHGPVVLRRVNYLANPTVESIGVGSIPTDWDNPQGRAFYFTNSDASRWGWDLQGGFPGPAMDFAWTGAEENSPSTATEISSSTLAYTNISPNPAFETISGTEPVGYAAGPGATLNNDGDTGAVEIVPDGSTTETYITFGPENTMQLGMVAGEAYTAILQASIYDMPGNLSEFSRRIVAVADGEVIATSTQLAMVETDAIPESPEVRLTFVVPPTATEVSLRFYAGTDDPALNMWIFNWSVIEAGPAGSIPYLGRVFNGGSGDPGGIYENSIVQSYPMAMPNTGAVVSLDLANNGGYEPEVWVRLRRTSDDVVLGEAQFSIDSTWRRYSFTTNASSNCYLEIETAGEVFASRMDVEIGVTPLPYLDGDQDEEDAMAGYLTHEIADEYEIGWLGEPLRSASYAQWVGIAVVGRSMQQVVDGLYTPSGVCDGYPRLDILQGTMSGVMGIGYRLPIPPDMQLRRYERTMHDVTCVEGPTTLSERKFTSGARMREVEFLLVAGNPFSYGYEQMVLYSQRMSTLDTTPWVDPVCAVEEPVAIVDPDCPPVPSPPRPPAIPNSCVTEESVWQRYWAQIPEDFVSTWSATSPKVVITTGVEAIRQVRVRVYPNPFRRKPTQFSRLNLVANPKGGSLFVNTAGWTAFPATTSVSRVSGQTNPGGPDTAIRVTATAAIASGQFRGQYTVTDLKPGKAYRLMAKIKGSNTNISRVQIDWQTAGGSSIAIDQSNAVNLSTTYKKHVAIGTAPEDAAKAVLRFGTTTGATALNATIDITEVVFEELPPGDQVTGIVVSRTAFQDGMPEYDDVTYPTSGVIAEAPNGELALKFDASAQTPDTYPALRGIPVTGLEDGKWYLTRATFILMPGIEFSHIYAYGDQAAGGTVTVTEEHAWINSDYTIFTPMTQNQGDPTADIEAGISDFDFTKGTGWLLNVEVLEVDYPDTYFDGDTEDADGFAYSWLGTPDGSQSLGLRPGVDPCSYCSEFVVSYLPPRTELTVDAIMQNAYASVSGAPAASAMHLLYAADGSPMTWPELSCGQEYLISIDVPEPLLDDVTVALSVVTRE